MVIIDITMASVVFCMSLCITHKMPLWGHIFEKRELSSQLFTVIGFGRFDFGGQWNPEVQVVGSLQLSPLGNRFKSEIESNFEQILDQARTLASRYFTYLPIVIIIALSIVLSVMFAFMAMICTVHRMPVLTMVIILPIASYLVACWLIFLRKRALAKARDALSRWLFLRNAEAIPNGLFTTICTVKLDGLSVQFYVLEHRFCVQFLMASSFRTANLPGNNLFIYNAVRWLCGSCFPGFVIMMKRHPIWKILIVVIFGLWLTAPDSKLAISEDRHVKRKLCLCQLMGRVEKALQDPEFDYSINSIFQ